MTFRQWLEYVSLLHMGGALGVALSWVFPPSRGTVIVWGAIGFLLFLVSLGL